MNAAIYRYLLNVKARTVGGVSFTAKDSANARLSEACAKLEKLREQQRVIDGMRDRTRQGGK